MQARVRDLNYSAIGKQIKRQIMYTRQEMDIKWISHLHSYPNGPLQTTGIHITDVPNPECVGT